jgi:DMSO reductase family type II enzyme chaperone
MYDTTNSLVTDTDPVTRSSVYQLLALAFKYPTPKLFDAYKNGDFLSELEELLALVPHLKELADETAALRDEVESDLKETSFQDFQVDFTRTFDVGAPEPPCPPYEGAHRPGVEKSAIMLAISEFYKHFGLKMDPAEGKRELPDHISAELEFLHFLTFKEAQARNEETEELLKGYLMAQRDFLQRHPAGWVPVFYQKLKESAVMPFYVQLAKIASDIIRCDLEWLNAELEDSLTAVG